MLFFRLVLCLLLLQQHSFAHEHEHEHERLKLRPCRLYEDTFGKWVNVTLVKNTLSSSSSSSSSISDSSGNSTDYYNYKQHFYGGGMGASLGFSDVWIPTSCSYHRFTNQTLHECAAYNIKKHNTTNGKFHIMFLGDSGTRGVICGITRLLGGSEIYGPQNNDICGGPSYGLPASTSRFGNYVNVEFGDIKITFEYIRDFHTRHVDWMLEWAILQEKPYAVVYNTGAWDFDAYSRKRNVSDPVSMMNHGCDSSEALAISQKRYAKDVMDAMISLSDMAKTVNTRIIYRNSHFNSRYRAFCADEVFEEKLRATGSLWEIWDNRNISHDVWQHQTWDGFHFDRHKIYSEVHHKQYMNSFIDMSKPLPGCMEMQLAQSLLQSVCHEYLNATYFNHMSH